MMKARTTSQLTKEHSLASGATCHPRPFSSTATNTPHNKRQRLGQAGGLRFSRPVDIPTSATSPLPAHRTFGGILGKYLMEYQEAATERNH